MSTNDRPEDGHGHEDTADGRRADVRAHVAALFDASDLTRAAEAEHDQRISELALDHLRELKVTSDVPMKALRARFADSRLPKHASDPGQYLDFIAKDVVPDSTRTASPRCMAHMTSVLPFFVRPLGKLLLTLNQNMVKADASKVLTPYERQTLGMMHRWVFNRGDAFYEEHVQHDDSTLGMMVSGGTLANITALWCARNAFMARQGQTPTLGKVGLQAALSAAGYRDAVIIGSELMHYSFEKAADLLGIGEGNLIRVSTGPDNRMVLSELERRIAECKAENRFVIAVVGVAGSTDAGSVDPLYEIHKIAHAAGIHFHVDAAWGGSLLFSEQYRDKLRGIELADSVTLDGHKQLYLPMGIGMVLLRDPHVASAIEKHAEYLARTGSADLGLRALEGSRPGMALFWHAALHIIGHDGFAFLVDESIRKTRHMVDLINARPGFELLVEPELNIVLYRYVPEAFRAAARAGTLSEKDTEAIDTFNVALHKAQRASGQSFVSRTRISNTRHGRSPTVALRAVVANPLTTEADIDALIEDQERVASTISLEALQRTPSR